MNDNERRHQRRSTKRAQAKNRVTGEIPGMDGLCWSDLPLSDEEIEILKMSDTFGTVGGLQTYVDPGHGSETVCPWCDGVGRSGRFICEVCQPDALTPVKFVPAKEEDDEW